MKFLCVSCDAQMVSVDQAAPDDGTLAIVFACPECRREVAMLANPMETQMVKGLCVEVGGRSTPERPLEGVRAHLGSEPPGDAASQKRSRGPVGREGVDGGEVADAVESAEGADVVAPAKPSWSPEAEARLARVPGFVRGMVRELYSDWARDHGVAEITVEVMDRARADVGLESM